MKGKTLTCAILFIVSFFKASPQNLIPNYSFEDTLQCIQGFNQFTGYVANWTGAVPQYFTALCNESEDSVPLNWWGVRYAHTGLAYAGIYTYVSDTCSTCPLMSKNLRDYIQGKLIDSLKAGMKYYVTFYVCPADTSWFYCNNMGAYFSDSALHYATTFQYVKSYLTPQIANDPIKNPLTIARTWIKISGSFIALGGEKYIVIGNFKNDSTSNIIYKGEVSTTEPDAFYYIDDVIVSPDSNYADSLEGIQELRVEKEEVKVFPNPSDGKFTIEEQGVRGREYVEVYNMLGEKIYEKQINSASTQIDLQTQPQGIYLYRITTEQGTFVQSGKLVIQ